MECEFTGCGKPADGFPSRVRDVHRNTHQARNVPGILLDRIQVSVVYKGASAEEIEESICVKIEEEIAGIEGIKKITSTAIDNQGMVIAELEDWADPGKVQDDIKNAVDQIDTFPKDVEKRSPLSSP